MTGRFIHQAVLAILLICQSSICLATETPDANSSTKYLDAVRNFADNVLKYGRDTYGPKHTPLFVDGLNIHTHEPVKWIAPNGDRWILSNLASQQNLFRALDGLTKINGDPKYKQAAMDAIKYAFENLRSPNGLLYWGGHAAYDVGADKPCGGRTHELKAFYAYYELMWKVDPQATKQFIESFWSAHILDWSNLDMNRHGDLKEPLEEPWRRDYEGGPVFFEGNGIPFATTGSDLYYAAAILSKLSGKKDPLIWAKRLAYRYVETRDPRTGISSYLYSLPKNPAKHPLADDFKGHMVHSGILFPPGIEQILDPKVRKCTLGSFIVSPGIPCTSFPNPWICSLVIGELLGEEGREFTRWALEELTARGRVAYRTTDNVWIPMLSDGTSLEGYAYKKDEIYGPKGTVFKPISAVPMDLWGYALAYRLTSDEFMWDMTRCIAQGNGLGDIGATAQDRPKLQIPSNHFDPHTLLAFLELYKKTRINAFLSAAQKVGDNILTTRFHKGFFVPSDKHIYSKLDAIEALVLLHLDATIHRKGSSVPQIWPGRPLFAWPFRDKERVVDNALIYTLTESPEPPRSLQEAAACGDVVEVRNLIQQGEDVDGKESVFLYTPLYHAVLKGHKDVVALLLAKGAHVDAIDAFPRGTPLHYAAEKGHTEIAALLIARGADVNAKKIGYHAGDTLLHTAVRIGHKDIVELLIVKGADVNVKTYDDQSALHIAIQRNRTEIVKLLIENGADVNVKNNKGQAPVDIAVSRRRNEVVRLLIAKGADVSLHVAARFGALAEVKSLIEGVADINAKDTSGQTPLHYAVQYGHRDIAELLIAKGADVNAKNDDGQPALHIAIQRNRTKIVKLLIESGADVNDKNNEGQTPVDVAASRDRREAMELLIEKGADVSIHVAVRFGSLAKVKSLIEEVADINAKDTSGQTPLHYAAEKGRKDIAELLIAKGADVNVKNKDGNTPGHVALWGNHSAVLDLLIAKGASLTSIHLSAYQGDLDKVRSFIERGTDVNAVDSYGATPLHYAAIRGNKEVVEFLFARGAHVNAKDTNDAAPVHFAADGGHKDIVQIFIVNGADVNAKDQWGYTPLRYAVGHEAVAELLIANGADVNVKDIWGSTPLHDAAKNGQEAVVRLLLTNGADVNAKNKWDLTPLDIAAAQGHAEIVELLKKQGIKEAQQISPPASSIRPREQPIADVIFTGEAVDDNFGNFFDAGGDVNGDGYNDLAVSAPQGHGGIMKGLVYLFHGGPSMDAEPEMVFAGENVKDSFGVGVVLVDINGDRSADVLVGSVGYDSHRGRVHIFYGGPNMDANPDKVFEGQDPNSWFGYSSLINDINGDNCLDLTVTAPGGSRGGRLYIFYGSQTEGIDTTADMILEGENLGDRFGRQHAVGDVNGDGYADLVVGAEHWYMGNEQGRAYLYFGGPKMDTKPDVIFTTGEGRKGRFGNATELCDIDNDGFADVIIGEPHGPNKAYLYFGGPDMDNVADKIFDFGDMIACGDVNKDGFKDIALGSGPVSEVRVYHGGPGRSIDQIPDKVFNGEMPNYYFGNWIGLSDLNGDSYDDLIAGTWEYNSNQGRVYLYYGGPDE